MQTTADAVHFLAFEGDFPIGTARLLPERPDRPRIRPQGLARAEGRRRTDAGGDSWRAEKRGLRAGSCSAHRCMPHRSTSALGFKIVSGEFLEVGIPHVDMVRE
jgi:hypothetical protein